MLRMGSINEYLSLRIAGVSSAKQLPQNLNIRHHADAVLFAKRLSGGSGKVLGIESAKNVRVAIGSCVEYGIVGGV